MEVDGWVQVSLGNFFVFENHPKIPLNQYRYVGVVYHVYFQNTHGIHTTFLYVHC